MFTSSISFFCCFFFIFCFVPHSHPQNHPEPFRRSFCDVARNPHTPRTSHNHPPLGFSPTTDIFLHLPTPILESIKNEWENSLIIKLVGKSLDFNHLSNTLFFIWKIKGSFKLYTLGKGFYSCKLTKAADLSLVKENGPWFIHGHYLHVQPWVQNFIASKETIRTIPTWLILSDLPMEYHRHDILKAIGNRLGGFIKADLNGIRHNKGQYARVADR